MCEFRAQNTLKSVCRRGFAPDPTWELTALPRPPSWFSEAASRSRHERGWGKGDGRGGAFPHFFFLQFNH